MGYAILRVDKIKSAVAGNARLKHNRRQTDCITTNPGKKNMCVFFNEQMEKDRYKNFREIFHERVKDQKIRKNAVYAIEVVQTFTENSIPEEKLEAWIEANAKWLCETFGESNIIDCQGHRDQKVFHLHTLIIPLDDGKLNAHKYLGGSRHRMMELQDSYSESMKQFGLSRGISREQTQARHESTKKWLNRQAEKENRLKAYEKKYGTEKDWCFDEMLEFRRLIRKEEKETGNPVFDEKDEEIEK